MMPQATPVKKMKSENGSNGKKTSVKELTPVQAKQQAKAEQQQQVLSQCAEELAEAIPKIKRDGKLIKLYIVTSAAYDGWIGERIAELLSMLRSDIKYWGHVRATHPLQKFKVNLVSLTPKKAVWRGEYYSTVPDRLVKDEMKITTKALPALYITGGLAVSLHRPKGEKKVPRVSVGALHKLQDVNASENYVGISILRYYESGRFSEEAIDFKTLTGRERELLRLPALRSKTQLKVLETVVNCDTAPTIGMLENLSGIDRSKLKDAIKVLEGKDILWCNEVTNRYDFTLDFLQRKTKYELPASGWQEDRIAAFACLHAGYDSLEEDFFLNKVAQHLIDFRANTLVGAGDFIAGIKHDLPAFGEVKGNYTDHELKAANLVAQLMIKVFRPRMDELLKNQDVKKLKSEEIVDLLKDALMQFWFKEGNHCLWVVPLGFSVLHTFREALCKELESEIAQYLNVKEICVNLKLIRELVGKKVLQVNECVLPSGLTVSVHHFHAGRMQTSSGWPQKALDFSGKHIVIFGNFHVAECVREWTPELGQRISLEVPTLLGKTNFESNKGKKTDVAVGFLRVNSVKGMIIKSEVEFLVP